MDTNFNEKCGLEFLQDRKFTSSVASAMRGRPGRIRRQSNRSGVPASHLRSTIPVGIIVSLGSIIVPLQRLEIGQFVPSVLCSGFNVIDFPTRLGRDISVCSPAHQLPTNILTDNFRAVARCDLPFLPHGLARGQIKGPVISVSIIGHFVVCFSWLDSVFLALSEEDLEPRQRTRGLIIQLQELCGLNLKWCG